MSRFGELLALFLQESEETERAMDRGGRLRRRKSLHQRLGLKSIVCCGSTWGFGASAMSVQNNNDSDNDEDYNYNENHIVESVHEQINVMDVNLTQLDTNPEPECTHPSPRMNLAAALAAERQFRSATVSGTDNNDVFMMSTDVGTPLRISLMRLLEETERETDGQDDGDEGLGKDQMCCVCMGRKKGAALIPCGHTFCRVCCRELWLNRGSCPLCNRSILEILDIY
ncbi:putative transcription factor C2H2 family [Helianthus annuus]|nr:putative transcription factor C2H2 family [Helianthus annuus]KAJ0460888.1 putative transcription factor C2H2 family [Helianthus annuus]KAJ0803683.1 putative transcription factor C2H2 family [Helianthus annuus]